MTALRPNASEFRRGAILTTPEEVSAFRCFLTATLDIPILLPIAVSVALPSFSSSLRISALLPSILTGAILPPCCMFNYP